MEHTTIQIRVTRGPVPLFHQIAEALRYAIATGRLNAGGRLPALREAAREWGVNLHTVRRAYAELADDGLVETSTPGGTRVVLRQAQKQPRPVDEFVGRIVSEARQTHGLSAEELAARISRLASQTVSAPSVHFVECSGAQAESHCRELENRWHVVAIPHSLSSIEGELPAGNIVATYFHYADIKSRWPEQVDRVRFVPIRPDADLADQLDANAPAETELRICEIDQAKVTHITSDLSALLPDRYTLIPHLVERADELLSSSDTTPILLAPRLWGALEQSQRMDPRVFEIRYSIDQDALDALGRNFSWTA